MAESTNTMSPLMPLSPAPSLVKRDSDDFLPRLEVHTGTKNTTARLNGPTHMPNELELQTKTNDDTQDSGRLEFKVSPMTTAITLQIFGMSISSPSPSLLRQLVTGGKLTRRFSNCIGRYWGCIFDMVAKKTTISTPHARMPGKWRWQPIVEDWPSSETIWDREI